MAPDTTVMTKSSVEGNGLFKALFARLSPAIGASFSEAQRAALAESAEQVGWGSHPTDIRLSIPFLTKRYYMVLVAGQERRSKSRRKQERRDHPLMTGANLAFLGTLVVAATLAGSFLWTTLFVWYLAG